MVDVPRRLPHSAASPSSSLVHASSLGVLTLHTSHCSFCLPIIYVLNHIHANHFFYTYSY